MAVNNQRFLSLKKVDEPEASDTTRRIHIVLDWVDDSRRGSIPE